MIILVTGGAGFIGSAVVRLAIARGHSVVNVDALTYAACLDNLASVAEHTNYAFEQVDSQSCGIGCGVHQIRPRCSDAFGGRIPCGSLN